MPENATDWIIYSDMFLVGTYFEKNRKYRRKYYSI